MKNLSGSSRRLWHVYTLAWLLAAVLALYYCHFQRTTTHRHS